MVISQKENITNISASHIDFLEMLWDEMGLDQEEINRRFETVSAKNKKCKYFGGGNSRNLSEP